jgi:hypothetical protein
MKSPITFRLLRRRLPTDDAMHRLGMEPGLGQDVLTVTAVDVNGVVQDQRNIEIVQDTAELKKQIHRAILNMNDAVKDLLDREALNAILALEEM